LNMREINALCFHPRAYCDSFHLYIDTHAPAVYSTDPRVHPIYCDTFPDEYLKEFHDTVSYRDFFSQIAISHLKTAVETCTFFTVNFSICYGRHAKTNKITIVHDKDFQNNIKDLGWHCIHAWYTRQSVSEPWTTTVMDPNYTQLSATLKNASFGSDYAEQMPVEMNKIVQKYNLTFFSKIGVQTTPVRHAAGLQVNECTQAGICYTGLCMTLLLLPLSPNKFRNGDEAIRFALSAADALVNTGEAFHFIHSVHENKYRDYVKNLFNRIGTYHPVTATIRLLKARINPFLYPESFTKPLRKNRSRTPPRTHSRLRVPEGG